MASPKLSRGSKGAIFNVLPAGTILPFAGAVAPEGWLICDGQAISRTEYSDLYESIGTLWGTGDGSTTFNLPDLEGRFLRGADNGAAVDPDAGTRVPLGSGVANGVGSLQSNTFSSHRHRMQYYLPGSTGDAQPFSSINTKVAARGTTGSYSFNPNGAGEVMEGQGGSETRPDNCSINYIIKL